ncbi:MAG: EFR1 family ferrodoxin [Oscillospiraceae bacterium]|nr:EFR1 family ferrodoxin [Oscillospiraceae bacterium]
MIFYFTGTGNSQYAAEYLAERERDTLFDMAEELQKTVSPTYELKTGEKVGFVFPVYYYGLPDLVFRFLKRASFDNLQNNYFYLLLTCGGSTGMAGRSFNDLCAIRGWDVKYQNAVKMPDNYIPMFDVPTGREIDHMLAAADEALAAVAEDIAAEETGDRNALKGKLPALVSFFAQPAYRLFGRRTKPFYVQAEKCVHCSVCAEHCPEGAITISADGTPVWNKARCTMCLQCINRCPARCIQYGKKTEQHGRYYNPRVLRK